MSPIDAAILADFVLYFLERNGLALIIATPALIFLAFNPPSKWIN